MRARGAIPEILPSAAAGPVACTPALPPAVLADRAVEAAEAAGATTKVWDEAALEEGGFGGILGVGAGSVRPPRLVRVAWEPEGATASVALMELGALVCTAASPKCAACPISDQCAWHLAGRPAYDGPPRRGQAWAGTDRMVRGRLMAVLRESEGSVGRPRMEQAWAEPVQRERALQSLLADGLVVESEGRYSLPG